MYTAFGKGWALQCFSLQKKMKPSPFQDAFPVRLPTPLTLIGDSRHLIQAHTSTQPDVNGYKLSENGPTESGAGRRKEGIDPLFGHSA